MLTREWFTAAELAELVLPVIPATTRGVSDHAQRMRWNRPEWEGKRWRRRAASGGGIEYHHSLLPLEAAAKVAMLFSKADIADEQATARARGTREEMWAWFETLSEKKQAEARRRLEALQAVRALELSGVGRQLSVSEIAKRVGIATSGLYRWEELIHGVARADWLPYLAPRQLGRMKEVEMPGEAWDVFASLYLKPERRTHTDCYRYLTSIAAERGWKLPSSRTFARRIEALPPQAVVLAREGVEALKRLYPAQRRDHEVFHAMQAVNADCHTWDVFVQWPGEKTPVRPTMVAFQDLYSGKILSWRFDLNPNREVVRLGFGDMIESHGIPEICYLDNGREFASKWITGRVPNRHRFKVRDTDPAGVMTQLGVDVRWVTPYSGQSKPIERAFRDLAGGLAKHPAFEGAYVGSNPMAKPENYGNAAVPLDTFVQVVGAGIAEHNARVGRRSRVCGGTLSFDQAFEASRAKSVIRVATEAQRRLWLMAAEQVRVRQNGQIELMGNAYWNEALYRMRGQLVTVRFDPQALHEPLHVYRHDGEADAYLGAAECVVAVGFNNVEAARENARNRRQWMKGQRMVVEAEARLKVRDIAEMLPKAESPEPTAPKVVRLTRGATALAPLPVEEEAEQEADYDFLIRHAERERRLRAERGYLNLVPLDEEDDAGA